MFFVVVFWLFIILLDVWILLLLEVIIFDVFVLLEELLVFILVFVWLLIWIDVVWFVKIGFVIIMNDFKIIDVKLNLYLCRE